MSSPVTLPAFTPEEQASVERLLALKVAHMMGRKLEEGDWSEVYCAAKGIPNRGWSNLNIDVVHGNLGVEHKMLCFRSKPTIDEACGTTQMHPSATRSFRIASLDADPNDVMVEVLTQYAELMDQRRAAVETQNDTSRPADMRTGWLLWQVSLRQFLYFEEPTKAPNPNDYYAEWRDRKGGARKASRNLWIYERATGRKRFSVTTSAGGKIQPYFDVPMRNDPNVYIFTVIGDQIDGGLIRVWVTYRTASELRRLIGGLDPKLVSTTILESVASMATDELGEEAADQDEVAPITVTEEAYEQLTSALGGVNDEHCFQLLVDYLASH
jgi:hypothetical protein